MKTFVRIAALAVAAAAATPAAAAPVAVSGTAPVAKAQIVKPLTLTRVADLNFGTILLGTLTANQTVSLTPAGALTCGSAGLTCSGTTAVAQYKVTGTNNQTVFIYSAATNLTNANDSTTIAFTPSVQASVALGNSGTAGVNFPVGGSIVITPTTTDGLYSGAINVTVDYN
ncbi:DUF4402 domain-containing protein [Sphingomonas ginkgonis]|uniref:DUF4402 domain-containing protein n=1 Tax=Sphingomonas ginkgonis TaxID=2315330 RepID=A0A429V7B0_9SPHN|nr:DUF4402 domain-containing protein [Sphingomonas ginkgonis]RST29772.1 DUF4402 domain-containing protein [Sphingomonas ginkgonis]